MKLIDHALKLAEKGFYVFPLRAGSKIPVIPNFAELSTRDIDQIKIWWGRDPYFNIGIYTGKFNGKGESLCAIDVDNKDGKKGSESLLKLELEGLTFPKTFEQITPTGGRHLIYKTKELVKTGVNTFAPDIDTRGYGGYVVGSGSIIDGESYYCIDIEVTEVSSDILSRCKRVIKKEIEFGKTEVVAVDQDRAAKHAKHYLDNEAPVAVQGEGGDQITFQVAARLKDFGLTQDNAFSLMVLPGGWNSRCQPPWHMNELKTKISNAYKYGEQFIGSKAPEVIFDKVDEKSDVEDPISELNKEYAFVTISGKSFILHETKDDNGYIKTEYLGLQNFHDRLRPITIMYGGKKYPISRLWMSSPERRSYDGICFRPQQKTPKNLYNIWKGFAVSTPDPETKMSLKAKNSLEAFLFHTKENICLGDQELYSWLIGFFAHLIQKPWEKPQVSLVFRGGKGVGKNAFIDRIGYLLDGNYILASDSRYLLGNFNSHLEKCLLFALDEALWSADKKAEGRLKDVITGQTHLIERKGAEPYVVKNLTRVVIIGNEDWLVPASQDERRFAVFDVGSGKKQNQQFFREMREGMEDGGYQLLLQFLNEFDISKIDIGVAPNTQGLQDQKLDSLPGVYQWWVACLREGRIVNSDFSNEWELKVNSERFRSAYHRYIKERGHKYPLNDVAFGRRLKACLPAIKNSREYTEGGRGRVYELPDLEVARKEWEAFIGHKFNWEG